MPGEKRKVRQSPRGDPHLRLHLTSECHISFLLFLFTHFAFKSLLSLLRLILFQLQHSLHSFPQINFSLSLATSCCSTFLVFFFLTFFNQVHQLFLCSLSSFCHAFFFFLLFNYPNPKYITNLIPIITINFSSCHVVKVFTLLICSQNKEKYYTR